MVRECVGCFEEAGVEGSGVCAFGSGTLWEI